jgi:hypothetical protein
LAFMCQIPGSGAVPPQSISISATNPAKCAPYQALSSDRKVQSHPASQIVDLFPDP